MITIPGYRIIQKIYSSARTQVYRGISELDQKPVVIKVLKSNYPTFNELVQFRNQYTIAKNLDLPGIVKHLNLETYGNGFALIVEDFGGVSLVEESKKWGKEGMGSNPDSLREFLQIAIQITTPLEGLYHNRIIHKDIKPHNILINPQTKQVKLIDFSISSLLPTEFKDIQNPNVLEGTLAYMSPEQTGRMNRGIDYRTDFYSLGVTFYELLTGQLPFDSNDPMELVHCHIARMPTPLNEVNPAIPQILNDIVLKLMAKTPEDRYQTAFGLKYDLEQCLAQFSLQGTITPFKLGVRDISEHFVIPDKLYGREAEIAILLAAFNRVSGRRTTEIFNGDIEIPNNDYNSGTSQSQIELMLVAGFSGIGKTAVVNAVHKQIVEQQGYFIKGKFDQLKRDIPFSAWVQAFQNLMHQLLSGSNTEVQNWQTKILAALGDNGQVIIDVIPELELLIGKQPPVPELEGSATQNRFNLLFSKFIRVFATKEHPLVIFLDDLQWADAASLKLIELLLSEAETQYLLLIGAYRDNEVFPGHPLILMLAEVRKADARVNQITLAPLDQSALNHLIADTLSCPLERADPLTQLVITKTQGNPFFSNHFLKSLHEDGLISFDLGCGYWQCDLAKVRSISVSADVVEFMAHQLQKLPINTQNVLKIAACIGNSFDLATLAIIHGKSESETATDLWRALQEGLVLPESEIYNFFQDQSVGKRNVHEQMMVPYKFLHDRVQQSAYYLIPDDQKQLTHLKIGKILLDKIPDTEREERIFDIVNQLNIGVELITNSRQRNELAQLNLIAGRKAKISTAYGAALRYLTVGMELLPDNSWVESYDLTLALYVTKAEVAYLYGDFEQMERLANTVHQQAQKLLDKVKVYEVKIQAYVAQNQMVEAVNTALQIVKLLGVYFPDQPSQLDIEKGLAETISMLANKQIERLIDLPKMTDPYKLAAMRILLRTNAAAYVAVPALMPLFIFKQVNLSVEYGNAPESVSSYAWYGLILCSVVGDIESGFKFGQLALSLLAQSPTQERKCMTVFMVNYYINHWQQPIKETLTHFRESYQSGLETGDLEFAAYSAHVRCAYGYFMGKELVSLERDIRVYSDALSQIKQESVFQRNELYRQVVLNLMGYGDNPCCLSGEAYNEELMLSVHVDASDRYALELLYLNKLILCYLFEEFVLAGENAAIAENYLDGVQGAIFVPIFHFYDSLAQLSLYPDATEPDQAYILGKVGTNQEKMQKWAAHAPMNYLHKFYLVEAERYRVLGQTVEAMEYYDRAISLAQDNEYVNENALANELAAKFYLAWGKEKIAQVYLTDAYYAYARWGAKAKVEYLERRYPQLLTPILHKQIIQKKDETLTQMLAKTVTGTGGPDISELMDLATVIKAYQALSGEIKLDNLLSTLMQVLIENAGAEKCALILEQAGELVISTNCLENRKFIWKTTPISQSQDLPVTLINYVWRTQETVVLNNASTQTIFAGDPYIIQHQPKSILCTPIQNQGKLIGILYLENNLTSAAFPPSRLEVLKLLSSQAAISLENARLYTNLEEYNRTLETKVEERTQELTQTLDHLKTTQQELIQSEKMAALGQLIAGVAHEINTPLGAIRSAIGNITDFLTENLQQLPEFCQQLSPQRHQDFLSLIQKSIQQTASLSTQEKRQAKRRLKAQLEAEKIENADSIASTLVNIGVFDDVQPFLSLLKDIDSNNILKTAYNLTSVIRSARTIATATERAAKIVFALKNYARYDHFGQKVKANITDGLETVLTLYQNQFKHGVEVIKNYAELPPISCYADELNQVWTNLIHNALQAMECKGTLKINVTSQNDHVLVTITDSGKGIPPEIIPKIFEPFFTTKAPGEGSGLGLDIVKKILAKHQGKIEVSSVPGQTTFIVYLPIDINEETSHV